MIKKLEENEKQSNIESPDLKGKSLKIIDTQNNKDKNKNCCK